MAHGSASVCTQLDFLDHTDNDAARADSHHFVVDLHFRRCGQHWNHRSIVVELLQSKALTRHGSETVLPGGIGKQRNDDLRAGYSGHLHHDHSAGHHLLSTREAERVSCTVRGSWQVYDSTSRISWTSDVGVYCSGTFLNVLDGGDRVFSHFQLSERETPFTVYSTQGEPEQD